MPELTFEQLLEKYRQLMAKSKRQRTAYRQLLKHVRCTTNATNAYTHSLMHQLRMEQDRQKRTDYRSVCQCQRCRLREWYRYRTGETYPGNQYHPRYGSNWRFPFKGRWPLWR